MNATDAAAPDTDADLLADDASLHETLAWIRNRYPHAGARFEQLDNPLRHPATLSISLPVPDAVTLRDQLVACGFHAASENLTTTRIARGPVSLIIDADTTTGQVLRLLARIMTDLETRTGGQLQAILTGREPWPAAIVRATDWQHTDGSYDRTEPSTLLMAWIDTAATHEPFGSPVTVTDPVQATLATLLGDLAGEFGIQADTPYDHDVIVIVVGELAGRHDIVATARALAAGFTTGAPDPRP